MREFDVITFGETMVRLSPPHLGTLEAASQLDICVGGSESNTAVSLARLGRRVSWFSRLGDNSLGRQIAGQLARWGVDVSQVQWASGERVGLYFVEFGAAPRPHSVLYDRADSAASRMQAGDVNWDCLDSARHLHVTGITPALSGSCAELFAHSIHEAKKRGLTVSVDVNYRSKLWDVSECRDAILAASPSIDLAICTLEDAASVFGLTDDPEQVAVSLRRLLSCGSAIITAGLQGVFGTNAEGSYHAPALVSVEIDRVGAGDSFSAGAIHGFLEGDLALGLKYGAAMAALKRTIHGDILTSTRQEIDAVVMGGGCEIQR
jgi:2-dehydro-3-deoxygluconokinase